MILSNGIIGTFAQGTQTTSGTRSLTLTRAIPAGRILIAGGLLTATATGNTATTSDSKGNTWVTIGTASITNIAVHLAICFVTIPMIVGDTVTVAFTNGPASGGMGVGVYEYTDLSPVSTDRSVQTNTGASVTSIATSAAIPGTGFGGSAGYFVAICGVQVNSAVTASSGWFNQQNTSVASTLAQFDFQELQPTAAGVVSSQTGGGSWTTAANAAYVGCCIRQAADTLHDRDYVRRPSGLVIPQRAVYRRAS